MKHNAYETKMMTVSELLEMDIKVPSYSAGRFHQWGERHERDFVRRMIDGMFPGAFLLGRDDKDQNGKFMLLDGQKRMSALRAYKEDPIGFLGLSVEAAARDICQKMQTSAPGARVAPGIMAAAITTARTIFENFENMPDGTLAALVNNAQYGNELNEAQQAFLDDVQRKLPDYGIGCEPADISGVLLPVTICTGDNAFVIQNYIAAKDLDDQWNMSKVLQCYWNIDSIPLGDDDGARKLLEYVKVHYENLLLHYEQTRGSYRLTTRLDSDGQLLGYVQDEGTNGKSEPISVDPESLMEKGSATPFELACALAGIIVNSAPIILTKMQGVPAMLEERSVTLGAFAFRSIFNISPLAPPEILYTEVPKKILTMSKQGLFGELISAIEDVSRKLDQAFRHTAIVPMRGEYAELFSLDKNDRFCPWAFGALWHAMYELSCDDDGIYTLVKKDSEEDRKNLVRQMINMSGYYAMFAIAPCEFYGFIRKAGTGRAPAEVVENFDVPVDWEHMRDMFRCWYEDYTKKQRYPVFSHEAKMVLSLFTCAAMGENVIEQIHADNIDFEFAPVFSIPDKFLDRRLSNRNKKEKNLTYYDCFGNWCLCPSEVADLLGSRSDPAKKSKGERSKKITSAWMAADAVYGKDSWFDTVLEGTCYPPEDVGAGEDMKKTYDFIRADITKGRFTGFRKQSIARMDEIAERFVDLLEEKTTRRLTTAGLE